MVEFEYSLPSSYSGLEIILGGFSRSIQIDFGLFNIFQMHLKISRILPRWFMNRFESTYGEGVKLRNGITLFHSAFIVNLMRVGERSFFHEVIYPLELLFGRVEYKSEELNTVNVNIDLPGDDDFYPTKITFKTVSLRHSRLPLAHSRINNVDIYCERGIPNGKHGFYYGFETECPNEIGTAIAMIQNDVMADREMFGFKPLVPMNKDL